jgi:group I intron endonuclease
MYGIIYKATGPGGRVYIGQTTKTLKMRKAGHKAQSLKKDRRSAFQIALLDEGFSNFAWEQIDSADTVEELDRKEKEWIVFYKANNPAFGYNLTNGGIFFSHSNETRRKISELNKGRPSNRKGKQHSQESIEKMIEAKRGGKNPNSKFTDEIVKQMLLLFRNGGKITEIARRFGTDRSTAGKIVHGQRWGHVTV